MMEEKKLDRIIVLKDIIEKHPKRPLIMAIDGRCAAGKTTLAKQLKQELEKSDMDRAVSCNVISMDHFFLQPHQRTRERLQTPGGNVDYERVLEEIMKPLLTGQRMVYRPFDCHTQSFAQEIVLEPASITIVEGAYSCHPALWDYYDLRVFLTVEKEEQLRRIEIRNKREAVLVFEEKWIPLEEAYFTAYSVEESCDFVL